MSVRIRFFAHLRQVFEGRERILDFAPGATVRELLDRIADEPRRRRELFQDGRINPHLVIIRNGIPLHRANDLSSALVDGDVLNIFPHLGGG